MRLQRRLPRGAAWNRNDSQYVFVTKRTIHRSSTEYDRLANPRGLVMDKRIFHPRAYCFEFTPRESGRRAHADFSAIIKLDFDKLRRPCGLKPPCHSPTLTSAKMLRDDNQQFVWVHLLFVKIPWG